MSCDVCKNEPSVGVASSVLGPLSLAYGRSCLDKGAEPYWLVVATVAMCGGDLNNLADWAKKIVLASLEVAGKTENELLADAKEEIEEMGNHG